MSLVGQQLGRYRLLEVLGQGGMSVVYRGLDPALEREVAVKVLHPHLAGKEEARLRLAREARAVAKLKHPNILEIFDVAGVDSPQAYIVAECIRGQTLREFAQSHPLDPPELAALVAYELASALAHAHASGVIHRDLKPENVMVRDDGRIKLMDFGIAKVIDRDERMTITGALVGSPAHMAPEIIEGEQATAESDVFSLGTVLYFLITTRLPFTASNTTATLRRILEGEYEDPRRLSPALSDELADIVSTCLSRQPSERYPDGAALAEALGNYLEGLKLGPATQELSSFFSDPPSYRRDLSHRLVETLLERAQRAMREDQPGRALAGLNQVLALDATNAAALGLVQQMNRVKRRRKRWLRLGQVAAGILGAGAVVAAGVWSARAVRARTAAREQAARPGVTANATEAPNREAALSTPAALGPTRELSRTLARVAKPVPPSLVKPPPEEPLPLPLVDVQVHIRPYGYVRVGQQPRSSQALPLHHLRLPPGKHLLTVTCDACIDGGETRVHEVEASDKPVELRRAAPLKPAQLKFEGFPPDAVAQVGTENRTVEESQREPFVISTPASGSLSMAHQVDYSVSLPGHRPFAGTARLLPGRTEAIRGKLEKE